MSTSIRQILLIDDEEHVRTAVTQTLQLAGHEVTASASAHDALGTLARDWPGIVVTDVKMPGMDGLDCLRAAQRIDPDLPVVLFTGHGDIAMAVQAMRDGAYDFLEKPFRNEVLLDIVSRALEKRSLVLENRRLRAALEQQEGNTLIGVSPAIAALRERLTDIAISGADVLVLGETGTGKEVVARALHTQSERNAGPFTAINCGAIPETMFESELFGHEAGAFTDARKRQIGKFEHADGGTVFLDEIESLPLNLGVKLLRVLQERCVERLGSNQTIPLDIRVIAASKYDLKALSAEGRFREDLYYRLNVVELRLPPLRDRREDVPVLFKHFVDLASQRYDREAPALDARHLAELMAHDWPGNVRELRNAADRFVVNSRISEPDPLTMQDAASPADLPLPKRVEHFEKTLIEQELRRHKGDVQATCAALGLPRKTFYDKLAKYGLDRKSFR